MEARGPKHIQVGWQTNPLLSSDPSEKEKCNMLFLLVGGAFAFRSFRRQSGGEKL